MYEIVLGSFFLLIDTCHSYKNNHSLFDCGNNTLPLLKK